MTLCAVLQLRAGGRTVYVLDAYHDKTRRGTAIVTMICVQVQDLEGSRGCFVKNLLANDRCSPAGHFQQGLGTRACNTIVHSRDAIVALSLYGIGGKVLLLFNTSDIQPGRIPLRLCTQGFATACNPLRPRRDRRVADGILRGLSRPQRHFCPSSTTCLPAPPAFQHDIAFNICQRVDMVCT